MVNIDYYNGFVTKTSVSKERIVVVIPPVNSIKQLFDEWNKVLHFPYSPDDWIFVRDLVTDMYWIEAKEILIYHQQIGNILPTWDVSEYLSFLLSLYEGEYEVEGHDISFYFNIEEKSVIDKFFPGKSLKEELERLNFKTNSHIQ